MARYEISPKERADEQRRHYHEFDAPDETYDDYLKRYTQPEARLSEPSKAGNESPSRITDGKCHEPGTGGSENRDERAA